MGTVTCLAPHTADMPEVDWLDWATPVLECPDCGAEFVVEDGELVPVRPTVMVADAIAEEDRRGWDGQRERALSSEPHWGGVLDG